jgi:KaiC/GvpD/RAD55 family RecA-like ATPase
MKSRDRIRQAWGERRKLASTTAAEIGAHDVDSPAALRVVSVADLGASLPPVRFVIERIGPRGFVTLLAGHGDVGKSLLALTLAGHIACGRRFADLVCIAGRALYVSLEDRGPLVGLRLARIAAAYELDLDAVQQNVTVLEATADDSALAFEHAADGTRRLVFTPVFEQVRQQAAGHAIVIVDNASDAFDANENERRLVRRFVRALQRIGEEHDVAVLLLAHVDKAAVRYGANGESYSGSTAWHNSVRSRLALAETATGVELRHEKSNLGPKLEHSIVLERNEHGVPMPLSHREREHAGRADARAVAAAIHGAIAAHVNVPTAVSGARTVTQVLAGRPELPATLASDPKRIRAALTTLEREGAIFRETYRDHRRHEVERYGCASVARQ